MYLYNMIDNNKISNQMDVECTTFRYPFIC